MNETEQLIEEQKKTLPPELLAAIESVPWKALVQEIGRGKALDAEQIAAMEQEVMLAIYGFENPANLSNNIAREVGVDETAAESIFDLVWEKIMKPISQKASGEDISSTSTPTPEPAVKTRPQSDTIVITKETKEDALKELTRREGLNNQNTSTNLPEIAPEIHPVPQQAGVASPVIAPRPSVSATSQPAQPAPQAPKSGVPLPDYRYPGGVDPYHEPIQ